MPAPLAATASSPRCVPFACHRGEQRTRAQAQAPASPAPAASQARGLPLGRAAGLVGGGIAAAFFASLERCSCVEVRTTDDVLADCKAGRDAEATPLMLDTGTGGRTAAAKSKRASSAAGAGKGRRGRGFGCWENIN